ncbi:hypothetical protein NX059_000156 [Plenodomus lindquistii]|nr:hypothetical protein NX059_000156 [Plenodomus lindquistii]
MAHSHYKPLDRTQRSIRLLTILPQLSATGLIQCDLRHDTINTTYTCLSYVWGSEDDKKVILINGREFDIRRNLWDFLQVARLKYADQARNFWIDALCIDQNSSEERNHQVAQMGLIYSHAAEVVSWLGLDERVRRAIVNILPPSLYYTGFCKGDGFEIWDQLNPQSIGQLKSDWLAVVRAEYWRRAWITQEIILARKLTLLVEDIEIEAPYMAKMTRVVGAINDRRGDVWLPPSEFDTDTRVFTTYLDAFEKRATSRQKLIKLFYQLPGRLCQYPRDRIYSLRDLASDAASISVDYDAPISSVLLQLLCIYRTEMCVCFWFYMVDMLQCRLEPEDGLFHKSPVFKVPMKIIDPEFVMGPDLTDSYYACPGCQMRVPGDTYHSSSNECSFCIKELCRSVTNAHLHLKRRRTAYGSKYSIKRDNGASFDVVHVEYGPDDLKADWNRNLVTLNVYLTIDVFMQVFDYDGSPHHGSDVPFGICTRATGGHSHVVFLETFDSRKCD